MRLRLFLTLAGAAIALALLPAPARTHCDGLDGPVVAAGRRALAERNLRPALVWVRAADEAEVRRGFERALAVRRLGHEAQALADTWFFETLVRLHREGEGEPYTGLKPAGRDLGPAIPAADRALASADPRPLVRMLDEAVTAGVRERLARARAALHGRDGHDLAMGRRFVREYVEFVHYVDRVHAAATAGTGGHATEPGTHHHPGDAEPVSQGAGGSP